MKREGARREPPAKNEKKGNREKQNSLSIIGVAFFIFIFFSDGTLTED